MDEIDVEFDDMLGVGNRGSKHSQHVSHCLSGLCSSGTNGFLELTTGLPA
jgi:hypothetical protein